MMEPIYRAGRELVLKLPAKVTGYSETEKDAAVEIYVSIGLIRTRVMLRPEELEKYVIDQEQKMVQEDKHGHWVVLENCSNAGVYCSECHTKIFDCYPMKKKFSYFCPHCGTRMEGVAVNWG